jgi:hypothetical protein
MGAIRKYISSTAALAGCSPRPQLPITSVVTPCITFAAASSRGSKKSRASDVDELRRHHHPARVVTSSGGRLLDLRVRSSLHGRSPFGQRPRPVQSKTPRKKRRFITGFRASKPTHHPREKKRARYVHAGMR